MLYSEEFLTSEDLLSLSRINLFMGPQVFMIMAEGESAAIVTVTKCATSWETFPVASGGRLLGLLRRST